MTPAARLAAAIEVLIDVEARHRPAAAALKDWGVSHRFAGSKDRAVIGNIVYDTLRWRASSAWAMDADTPRALVLGTAGRRWGYGGLGLRELFAGDRHAPEPISEAEVTAIDGADLETAPPHVRADVPEWLAPQFAAAFGDDWVAEGAALAERPPLDVRVNSLKADREKVAKALARYQVQQTAHAPSGLRIAPTERDGRHPNLQVEPGFQKGWFEIQDEGSQLASGFVAAKPGEQILDLCAGAGGKTLALAAAMANKGQVFATDSDRSRLAPIFDRLKRAGTRNVQVRPAGADLTDLTGRMDAVLIDVPCTGTGVWRRRPDAKWRLREHALQQRIKEQAALLDDAVRYLKPGGRLVYVTCSVLPVENDRQVEAFLERRAGAVSLPADILAPALGTAVYRSATGVALTPLRTGTDGFFVSVVEKV
ncbi:RsmB/NOP family class I SAM-dependent RNA methyltransferase [Bauldia sp.]|uniref:RsmB/NOP family class I SAM-dependent RNA methyltransferase n=1 Tax=Bauldia sp. TaxID=2575872 RepID=UPI003BAB7E0E